MFSYGRDQGTVGITGIRGCMGIVYAGNGSMFAIHIPPDKDEIQLSAREAFETYVKNNEPTIGRGHGYLFAFINGKNRPDAVAEMKDMKKRLKNPPTFLYRINKHLGTGSGGFEADSVAIMVERVHATESNPSGCAMWYKRNDAIVWVAGGAHEAGQYKDRAPYRGDSIPSDLNAQWWRMSAENCTIIKV